MGLLHTHSRRVQSRTSGNENYLPVRSLLGEGPCWDKRLNCLIWVDIEGCTIHFYYLENSLLQTVVLDKQVSAVVPTKAGGHMALLSDGFYSLNVKNFSLSPIVTISQQDNVRFNDGKCDAAGRFWAGTMSTQGEKNIGKLYCLENNGTLRTVLENVTTSNGIGWSPDNKSMYYIDTDTLSVVMFDYSIEEGTISNGKVIVRFDYTQGIPDGMTVDSEGNIWVAQWGGGTVSRWDPHTGVLLDELHVPADNVTSCVFGGYSLSHLYVTTARDTRDAIGETLDGYMFCYPTNIRGLDSYSFG